MGVKRRPVTLWNGGAKHVFGLLLEDCNHRDITIVCSDGRVFAHRMLLAASTPLFWSLLHDPASDVVILPDFSQIVVRKWLSLVYQREVLLNEEDTVKCKELLGLLNYSKDASFFAEKNSEVNQDAIEVSRPKKKRRKEKAEVSENLNDSNAGIEESMVTEADVTLLEELSEEPSPEPNVQLEVFGSHIHVRLETEHKEVEDIIQKKKKKKKKEKKSREEEDIPNKSSSSKHKKRKSREKEVFEIAEVSSHESEKPPSSKSEPLTCRSSDSKSSECEKKIIQENGSKEDCAEHIPNQKEKKVKEEKDKRDPSPDVKVLQIVELMQAVPKKSMMPQAMVEKLNLQPSVILSLTCLLCWKQFPSNEELDEHRKSHGSNPKYRCHICSQEMQCEQEYHHHLLWHVKGKIRRCLVCDRECKTEHGLKIHLGKHYGAKISIYCKTIAPPENFCFVCHQNFRSRTEYQVHCRTHSIGSLHKCDICLRGFATRKTCLNHRSMHTGIKPFKCPYCSKVYRIRKILNNHIKRKHQMK